MGCSSHTDVTKCEGWPRYINKENEPKLKIKYNRLCYKLQERMEEGTWKVWIRLNQTLEPIASKEWKMVVKR